MWGGIPKGRWGHSSSTCSQAHREHEVPKPIVLLPLLFCQKSRALSTPCFLAPIKVKTDPRSSSASGGRGRTFILQHFRLPAFCLHPNDPSLATSSSPNYVTLLVAGSLDDRGNPMLSVPSARSYLQFYSSFSRLL